MGIKTKPFKPNYVTHDHREKKRTEVNMLQDQGSWDRKIENEARQSFQETEKLREKAETMVDINKIREGVKADINNKVKRLLNLPTHKWTNKEDVLYENLPKDLQKLIDKKHKKRHGF